MKPDFSELISDYNGHSFFLNETGLKKAMEVVYDKGKNDGINEVLSWLSTMDYLSDNIKYIKEEWENQNK